MRDSAEAEGYKARMRELSRSREFRTQFRDLTRQPFEVTEQQLAELGLNTQVSTRAKTERLFRAIMRTIGAAEVPWVPETDEAERLVHERACETDAEPTRPERQVTWPSDRGLLTISELPNGAMGLHSHPPPLFTMASSRYEAAHTHQASSRYSEAGRILRITVREEGNHGAGQYLPWGHGTIFWNLAELRSTRPVPESGKETRSHFEVQGRRKRGIDRG